MRIKLHPLEVFGLSLLGPLTLFVLFWLFLPGRERVQAVDGGLAAPVRHRSRTRPIRIYQGDLEGWGPIRVFPGLTPGLGFGRPLAESRTRLGLDEEGGVFTLLLCNGQDAPRPAPGPGWQLRQGGDRVWHYSRPPARLPRGGLFTDPGMQVPVGRIARLLFTGEAPSGEGTLVLDHPQGQTSLEPRKMPAQEVYRF